MKYYFLIPIKASKIFLMLLPLIFLNCNSDNYVELSGDYFYCDEGPVLKEIISHLPNQKNIYSKIINYDYNSNFIIAVQEPNFIGYREMLAFELRDDLKKYPTNSLEEMNKSEIIADSILKNNDYYKKIFANKINYWIISHQSKQVFGPFTKVEYLKKREELKIPNELQLQW